MKQLDIYRPFPKVHIIHNKGFRKCKKDCRIKTTGDDLSDVYGNIFRECLHFRYNKVLIFEDDFFFTEPFESIYKYTRSIKTFLQDNPQFFTYNLGALPWFMLPFTTDLNHFVYKGGIAHSVIYSQSYMNEYVQHYKNMTCLSDSFWNKYTHNYCFYKAICFQLFPRTENSANWSNYIDIVGIKHKLFQADKEHKYVFTFCYWFAKVWYIIVILVLVSMKIKFKK